MEETWSFAIRVFFRKFSNEDFSVSTQPNPKILCLGFVPNQPWSLPTLICRFCVNEWFQNVLKNSLFSRLVNLRSTYLDKFSTNSNFFFEFQHNSTLITFNSPWSFNGNERCLMCVKVCLCSFDIAPSPWFRFFLIWIVACPNAQI